jgi:hypothetical protein
MKQILRRFFCPTYFRHTSSRAQRPGPVQGTRGVTVPDFATHEALLAKEVKYGQSSARRPTVRRTAFVRAVFAWRSE